MIRYKAKTWDGGALPPFAEVKADGHFTTIERKLDGSLWVMTTSFINIIGKVGHYDFVRLADSHLERGQQIDGELCVPGGTSEDVKTAIKNSDPRLKFVAFATSMLHPSEPSDRVNQELMSWGFATPGLVSTKHHTEETLLGYAILRNHEGWVLKHGNYDRWYKLKVERTIDLWIGGVKPGQNKYVGMIGSFECYTSCGTQVANVPGMPDSIRAMDPFDCMSRVIEVKYQRVGHNGKLLLPRFKGWRDDKKMSDCPLGQDPALERYYVRSND